MTNNTKLSPNAIAILQLHRFSFKAPNSFTEGSENWTDNRPVLWRRPDGRMGISVSSFNTRPTNPNDTEAANALRELFAVMEGKKISVDLRPGDWIVFDNSLLLHDRGKIGDGPRLLFRNYIRGNCDAMRAATGTVGPIFSARALLKAGSAIAEGARHAN